MERPDSQSENPNSSSLQRSSARRGEQGYALIALLALMTIMALLLVSAVPSVRQQTQRSLEEEAIWRGEQVAEAIRQYVRGRGTLPTSMDQLLEGIPRGTKKVQILRSVAARDPLSSSGEWRLIRKDDPAFLDFQRAVLAYADLPAVNTTDQAFIGVAGPLPVVTNILDTGLKDDCTSGGEEASANSTGPFIGVASRSHHKSIIAYYGIECHDKWIFTPYFR